MSKIPFFEKYTSSNPVHKYLVGGFIRRLTELVDAVRPRSILEIGCGEGFLAAALAKKGYPVRGIDIREDAIEFAKAQAQELGLSHLLTFSTGDLYSIPIESLNADLVVCCEVLEHVERPEAALDILCKISENAIISVPEEPLWRVLNLLRLKYLGALGNTPGHINHWSRNGFIGFLTSRYTIQRRVSPLPWTMALCKSKSTFPGE